MRAKSTRANRRMHPAKPVGSQVGLQFRSGTNEVLLQAESLSFRQRIGTEVSRHNRCDGCPNSSMSGLPERKVHCPWRPRALGSPRQVNRSKARFQRPMPHRHSPDYSNRANGKAPDFRLEHYPDRPSGFRRVLPPDAGEGPAPPSSHLSLRVAATPPEHRRFRTRSSGRFGPRFHDRRPD